MEERNWESETPEQSNQPPRGEEWDVGIPPFTTHFRNFFAFLEREEKEEKT